MKIQWLFHFLTFFLSDSGYFQVWLEIRYVSTLLEFDRSLKSQVALNASFDVILEILYLHRLMKTKQSIGLALVSVVTAGGSYCESNTKEISRFQQLHILYLL